MDNHCVQFPPPDEAVVSSLERTTPIPKPEKSVFEDFEIRYVRVYSMKDGTRHVAPHLYSLHEQAFADLQNFHFVSGKTMDDVSYATIERRFYPFRGTRTLADEEGYSIVFRPQLF